MRVALSGRTAPARGVRGSYVSMARMRGENGGHARLIFADSIVTGMTEFEMSPGLAAHYAFRSGMLASAAIGLAAIGALYLTGVIELVIAGFAVVMLFPVYLVLAAVVLSRWLGYDKDHTALRPVYRPK